MQKIAVIGTGYVGLTAAIGLADFGSKVIGVDIDVKKIAKLKQGEIPIYEPGIKEVMNSNMKEGRLSFTDDLANSIKWADVIFIGVGTPQGDDGRADITAVFEVAREIGCNLNRYKIIVTKSTVTVGTNEKIYDIIAECNHDQFEFDVVSNPEFLREGKALYDFLHPDRVVFGVSSQRPIEIMKNIYRPLYLSEVPFIITDWRTAEIIKYASNCFLAVKVAYINEMARFCDAIGANVQVMAHAMGKDARIGSKFLHPGPGFGGSCFPKDTNAMVALAKEYDVDLGMVIATVSSNNNHKNYVAEKIIAQFGGNLIGVRLAVLGLSFKADTDDIRDSAAIVVIKALLEHGAEVIVYDPKAMENAKSILNGKIQFAMDEYSAVAAVDGVIIITEWNQFRNLDIERIVNAMKGKYFFDLRNIYKRYEIEKYGLVYSGMGT